MNDVIECTVAALDGDGNGVCHHAQGRLAVPFVLPGEAVRLRLGAEGKPVGVDLRAAAPFRATPPCSSFGRCGGCRLQHAAPDWLTRWKEERVLALLARRGLEAPLRPAHRSPPASRRRATLAGRRTKKGALVGFNARRSHEIVPPRGCTLLRPELLAVLPLLARIVEAGGSRRGTLDLALTASENGIDIAVRGGKPLDLDLRMALAGIAAAGPVARIAWDDEVVLTVAAPVQRFGKAEVVPPPGAFLQATREGEAAMVAEVREILAGAARVIDLFAGCGTFTFPLAETAGVNAVEKSRPMLEAVEEAARRAQGLKPVAAARRDLFARPLTPEELRGVDGAVIDPPRAGAEAQARMLAAAPPELERLAYVSCNPVSFARDAAILVEGGWRLRHLRVIDQFLWSPHVELVAAFTRGAA